MADSVQPAGPFSLDLKDISKSFGDITICKDVSLELAAGDSVAIVGPNGAGKTTFVRMLAGLARPDHGAVSYRLGERDVPREEWYRHVGMVAPDLALYEELTAAENLAFFARVLGVPWGDSDSDASLEHMQLAERRDQRVGEFSSGMKQRLKYAVALAQKPSLLICDEPTANLDEPGIELVRNILRNSRAATVIATNSADEAGWAKRSLRVGIAQSGGVMTETVT